MKYFLIAGEASGDLHAAHLMQELLKSDSKAEFQFYGGDAMAKVSSGLLCHYRSLAYMGFIPVLLHARTILRGMKRCKEQIAAFQPDVLILVDYPGFNLRMARFAHEEKICKVYYYISPKIWAWKEHRIEAIRRYVDVLYSILPFEIDFFEKKHQYPITYVGNPTVDEVEQYRLQQPQSDVAPTKMIALLPGSRSQEIRDNFSRMLRAVSPLLAQGYRLGVAVAPSQPLSVYEKVIAKENIDKTVIDLIENDTYGLLSRATAALVTSGTATLETALFRVPQVVCYYIAFGPFFRLLRKFFLKVPYISLVNLVCQKEVVSELVADRMTPQNVRKELYKILPGEEGRAKMLKDYEEMAAFLGQPGAPQRAAADMVKRLQQK